MGSSPLNHTICATTMKARHDLTHLGLDKLVIQAVRSRYDVVASCRLLVKTLQAISCVIASATLIRMFVFQGRI